MKIALLSLNYLPSTGGLVTYLKSFSKYLSSNNEVHIFCVHERGSQAPSIEIQGTVTIHRIHCLPTTLFGKLFGPWLIVRRIKQYFSQIDLDKYDLFLCRHFYFAFVLSVLKAKKTVFLLPLVAPRLVWINSANTGLVNKIATLFLIVQIYLIERKAVKSGIKVAVLSQSKKEEVEQFYGIRKVRVTSPGFDLERFNLEGRETDDVYNILSVCRLVEEKNIELTIDAVGHLVKNSDFPIIYRIVGGGPLLDSLKEKVQKLSLENNIIFVGETSTPEIYYKRSDLFVLCSKYEGFGHVYLEANACGLPALALANNVDGSITAADEIIVPGINGELLYQNDPIQLSGLIHKNLSKDESVRLRCNNYIQDMYSWKKHLKNIIEILNE